MIVLVPEFCQLTFFILLSSSLITCSSCQVHLSFDQSISKLLVHFFLGDFHDGDNFWHYFFTIISLILLQTNGDVFNCGSNKIFTKNLWSFFAFLPQLFPVSFRSNEMLRGRRFHVTSFTALYSKMFPKTCPDPRLLFLSLFFTKYLLFLWKFFHFCICFALGHVITPHKRSQKWRFLAKVKKLNCFNLFITQDYSGKQLMVDSTFKKGSFEVCLVT